MSTGEELLLRHCFSGGIVITRVHRSHWVPLATPTWIFAEENDPMPLVFAKLVGQIHQNNKGSLNSIPILNLILERTAHSSLS